MVTCSFTRDSVASASNINFLKSNIIQFYAGFNVFEDKLSELRIAGGVSKKMELRLFEEADAAVSQLSAYAVGAAALMLSSFAF